MKLVYTSNKQPVRIGDHVLTSAGDACIVVSFREPHKPSSSGHVTVGFGGGGTAEYYCGVIGAEWIDREDRA